MSDRSHINITRLVAVNLLALAIVALSACGGTDEVVGADNQASDEVEDDTGDEATEGGDSQEDDHGDHDDGGADDGAGGSGGLGAHEHGAAELSVAWSEGDVVVDLISPAANIFGFEHEPESDDELAVAAEQTAALSAPGIVDINAEARCEPAGGATTELDVQGSHAELIVSWLFVCERPDEIEHLDTAGLFAGFPELVDIDAQWASSSAQSAAELTPSSTILRFG